MKKITKLFVLMICIVLAVCVITATASAAEVVASGECGENVTWKLTDDGTLTISGEGSMTTYFLRDNPWFEYRRQVKSIVVESGIKSLSDYAFFDFPFLTSVRLPEGLTYMGWGAFEQCASLSEITFPSTFVNLDDTVLAECDALKSVTFTGDAPQISPNTFNGTITTVYYPPNNDTWNSIINKNYGGTLKWVPIGSEIPAEEYIASGSLGDHIIWKLADDGTLTISGEGEMRNFASQTMFYRTWEHVWETHDEEEGWDNGDGNANRNKIIKVIIEDGITSIGDMVFWNCRNLKAVSIPESVSRIGYESFYNCESLSAVNIPDTVADIDRWAFVYCQSLESVTIPASLETIKLGTFEDCSSLRNVVMPDSVKTIESRVFENCRSLKVVDIPASVSEIGWGVFHGCRDLEAIHVDAENPNYCSDSRGVLFNKDKTALIVAPGGLTGEYVIPEGVTTIGQNTDGFALCNGLTSVTIPNTVTGIAPYSFEGCTSLTDIALPKNLDAIQEFVFTDCTNLKTVTLPENLKWILDGSFKNCSSLETIMLPKEVESINPLAFAECTSLKAFAVDPDNEHFSVDEKGVLFNKDKTALIAVPGALSGEYVIPASVREIYYFAINDCPNLTSITIPASATIGYTGDSPLYIDNFSGCNNLRSIWADADNPYYTSDEKGILYNKDKSMLLLVPEGYEGELAIPAATTEIRSSAFTNCSMLTGIIADEANPEYSSENGILFNKDKTVLVLLPRSYSGEYTVPDSVETILSPAFADCDHLTKVTIPSSVVSIHAGAFGNKATFKEIVFLGDKPFSTDLYPLEVFVGTCVIIQYPAFNESWAGIENNCDDCIMFIANGIIGDVTFDGEITNADLIMVARFVVHMVDVFSPSYLNVLRYGDMDGDEVIGNTDIISLARAIVGLE